MHLARIVALGLLAAALPVAAASCAAGDARAPRLASTSGVDGDARRIRVATFNAALHRDAPGALLADLAGGHDEQARTIAEIVQRTRPDVLLLNEFDFDASGATLQVLLESYLAVAQRGAAPIRYPFTFVAPSNTGVPTGFDLDRDGRTGGPGDAQGFGAFPGRYGMAVLSRFPIARDDVRTFRTFLWKDLPGALLPDDPGTPAPGDWYPPAALDVLRLSSKSHWDMPIVIEGRTLHLLASHPTPPVFDGPEDRNGRRNHDEIRFWADYVTPGAGAYVVDDRGRAGGLARGASFVIAGDLNADPCDGDATGDGVRQLMRLPNVHGDVAPASRGGVDAAARQGGANDEHAGDPALDTADFVDHGAGAPGNLRVDHVLPSRDLVVEDAGVFWPVPGDPLGRLVARGAASSDHRLVWVDIVLPDVAPRDR